MSNKKKKHNPSGANGGAPEAAPSGVKPSGSGTVNPTSHKGGNPGAPHEAGDHQVQGASHQGSSLGKRNSG